MNREEMLGPAVSPETGEAYERGTGYKGIAFGGLFVVAIAAKVIYSMTGGFGGAEAARPDLAAQIAADVARTRAQLPMRADEFTTFAGISSEGTRVTFDMRLDGDIPTASIAAAAREQQAHVERTACAMPDMRRLIAAGAMLTWHYTDRSGDTFDTRLSSCGRSQASAPGR